eukprot:Nitzschia sp. Nitz4//scaffold749_size1402//574//1401//NITZ4_009324-RA/size1402-processed-gene-0.0-mRNA-1//1//CDS//3329557537//2045//frame0
MVANPTNYNRKKTGSESQFPGRLHNLMEYVEQEGLQHAISWVLNGRGIQVNDPDSLVKLLPLFFSQTKYRSFRRQLNMWHFERIEKGPHKGAFIHPYFVRDNRELCGCMSRQVSLKPRHDPSLFSLEPESFALESDILEPNNVYESQHDESAYPTRTVQSMQQSINSSRGWLEPNPLVDVKIGHQVGTAYGDMSKLSDMTPLPVNLPSSVVKQTPMQWQMAARTSLDRMLPSFIESEARMALEPLALDGLFFDKPSDPLDINLDDFDLDVTGFTV